MIDTQVSYKVEELIRELKRTGIWKQQEPAWIKDFSGTEIPEVNFFEWLQFVYLPNRVVNHQQAEQGKESYIMLQAIEHLKGNNENDKIIRLLIELDSL